MKKSDIYAAYAVVNKAKLTKLDDAAKIKVIKACKEMRPIAVDLEEFTKEAADKLAGERHEEIMKRAEQWKIEGTQTGLSIEERVEINEYMAAWNKRTDECLKEEHGKDVELKFAKLTDEEFMKLMASNDWTAGECAAAESVLLDV